MDESPDNPYRSPSEPESDALLRLKELLKDRTAKGILLGVCGMAIILATSLAEGRTGLAVYGNVFVLLLLLFDFGRRYSRVPKPPGK
jgi:hypothetical protein